MRLTLLLATLAALACPSARAERLAVGPLTRRALTTMATRAGVNHVTETWQQTTRGAEVRFAASAKGRVHAVELALDVGSHAAGHDLVLSGARVG